MIIDSHQHFWKYNPVRDSWIDESMQTIRRDFLPKDLKPIFQNNTIDGCIAVQADQSETETNFLLDLAEKNSFIKGVVGWVDLCSANIEERLYYFSKNTIFKGVRHILQAEDAAFFKNKKFLNGVGKLSHFNLTYDILIYHHQLKGAIELVKMFPDQKFVLDHIAKPNIKKQEIIDWKNNIQEIAQYKNVYCKISGMFTEADWKSWSTNDFKPYLDVVFEVFGTKRVMYGSDWPVCLLAVDYNKQFAIINKFLSLFSFEDRNKIMGQNAQVFYNL